MALNEGAVNLRIWLGFCHLCENQTVNVIGDVSAMSDPFPHEVDERFGMKRADAQKRLENS